MKIYRIAMVCVLLATSLLVVAPVGAQEAQDTYTVVAGDTLYEIASRPLGDGDRYFLGLGAQLPRQSGEPCWGRDDMPSLAHPTSCSFPDWPSCLPSWALTCWAMAWIPACGCKGRAIT